MTNMKIDHYKDDYLVQATAKQGLLRCLAVRTTKLVDETRAIHDLSPASTVALGRLMSGALLMSADLKSEQDQLTLITKSDGEISNMSAIATLEGKIRGYVNLAQAPSHYYSEGKFNIAKSVGKGSLTVIKDLGLKEPYIGNVELISGEIAEDLASYYFYSEQIPTILFLGVRLDKEGVVAAGGMLIQALPGADDDILNWLESRAIGFPDLSELIEQGISPHQLIDLLLGDADIEYLKEYPVSYFCPCTRERMTGNLLLLGEKDLLELANDPDGINLECHYCGTNYKYTQDELKHLAAEAKTTKSKSEKPKFNIVDIFNDDNEIQN